jgi:L-malate glycosyltransferase
MNLLFVYQYCTKGGVEVVLRNRMEILRRLYPLINTDVLFFEDLGGVDLFEDFKKNVIICKNYKLIKQHIKKNQYDFIITIDTPQIYEILSGSDDKIILEVHTAYKDMRKYLRSIDIMSTKTLAIVVPSYSFKNSILNELDDMIPIYVFPNFVGDSFRRQYNESIIKPNSSKKIIGWIGRLDRLKNWREFIEISSRLIKSRNDINILIVGGLNSPESEKVALFNDLKKNHLLPYTRWLPFFNSIPLLYKYILESKGCFVSTSLNESFGMTVLEAMICKCPVICSNISASAELLDGGKCGVLYDLGDINMAVNKVNAILDNFDLRKDNVDKAYKAAIDVYDPEKIIADWLSFLVELAKM